MTEGTLLHLSGLRVAFGAADRRVEVVRGLDLDVDTGEAVGIVGESGSGKSVTGRAILGILDPATTSVSCDAFTFKGEALTLSAAAARRERRSIAMVFQNPFTSLNPVFKVGTLLTEVVRRGRRMNRAQARAEAVRLLDSVRIPNAAARLRAYPHEFSGGMQQRVVIALALALDPDLLIADEPTTALDVTVQAEVVNLLHELRTERRMGIVFVSHDLGLVSEFASRVYVMYAGRVVETGGADVMAGGRHPYTRGLLASVPSLAARERMRTIAGSPPLAGSYPGGCAFHPRCPYATPECEAEQPAAETLGDRHLASCHHLAEVTR